MNILLLIEFDGHEVSRYFANMDAAREYTKQFPRFFKFTAYKLTKLAEL